MELNQIQFNCNSNLNNWNAKMITYTSEAFHTHDHLDYKIQILANATWYNLNYIWSLNLNSFSNQLQLTWCKWNLDHLNAIHIIWQHNHVLEHCNLFMLWLLCLLSNRRATGIGGHPLRWRHFYRISSARQATPHWSCR